MTQSRTKHSIKNSGYAILSQMITIILSFLVRTIFIKTLDESYLGINGLFSNILMLLSFAELGFGTAIVYAMYKPIAKQDEVKISAYMNYYAKIYRFIGTLILVVGLCLIPNLEFFINDVSVLPDNMPPLWLIYVLFLLNTASSYFFNYKRSLIIASQKGYIDSMNQLYFNLIRSIAQIVVLLFWKGYLLYLISQIICTILANIFISLKADKMYPFLKQNKHASLDKTELKALQKNVMAMAFHKFGSVIVSGTDNILISKFVGLSATATFSNYVLLTSTVRTLFVQILSPITASVGNFVAVQSKEESYQFFHKLFFLNAYMAIFCSSCLMILVNPFIEILWGENYLFPYYIVACLMMNFFLDRMRLTSQIFIDTNGLFWPIRWKSFIEAIINLSMSLILIKIFNLGILGVILGTTISNLLTNFWWEPYIVYKLVFEKNLFSYFIAYSKYLLTLIITIGLTALITISIPTTFIGFIIKTVIAVIIPNLLMFLLYYRSDEYQYFVNMLLKIIKPSKV